MQLQLGASLENDHGTSCTLRPHLDRRIQTDVVFRVSAVLPLW